VGRPGTALGARSYFYETASFTAPAVFSIRFGFSVVPNMRESGCVGGGNAAVSFGYGASS
jgi:hypothetical protein